MALLTRYDITDLSNGRVADFPPARPRPGHGLVTAPVTVGRVSIHTT